MVCRSGGQWVRVGPGSGNLFSMQAAVGDRLHFHSNAVGMKDRVGEIVEVRGSNGTPPYVVRFPDGHTSTVYPGPDCVIEPSGGAGPGQSGP